MTGVEQFQLKVIPAYVEQLNQLDIEYAHSSKDEITLNDIYIYPDLRKVSTSARGSESLLDGSRLIDLVDREKVVVLSGPEQSGCTSFARKLYLDLIARDVAPLFVEMPAASSRRIENRINRSIAQQYNEQPGIYFRSTATKVLLLDNFEVVGSSGLVVQSLVERLCSQFDAVVIFSDDRVRFDEALYLQLVDYPRYEIQQFGNQKRAELIEAWSKLGEGAKLSEAQLLKQTDRVFRNVNLIVRRNLIPRTPFFILSVIQQLENFQGTDISLTSFGHCYQSLIVAALGRAGIRPQEFDQYLNYLSELAFFIYSENEKKISHIKLEEFKRVYSANFYVDSHDHILARLQAAKILTFAGDSCTFGYRFIFYFYVAKRISDDFPSESSESAIRELLSSLYSERNANILIFITHHTRDERVLKMILGHAKSYYSELEPATLSQGEVAHLLEHFAAIPKLVLENRDPRTERRKLHHAQDRIDDAAETAEVAEEAGTTEIEDLSEEDEVDRSYRDLASSARIVEVMGQITKNRYGSLRHASLSELFDEAEAVGMRVVRSFLTALEIHQDAVLDYIANLFQSNSRMERSEAIKETRRIYMLFCHGYIFGVISKLSSSLGSDELIGLFRERQANTNLSPASRLLYSFILLEFGDDFPEAALSDLYRDLEGNEVSRRLLQSAVLQHLYIHKVNFKQKQRLEHSVGLQSAVSIVPQIPRDKSSPV